MNFREQNSRMMKTIRGQLGGKVIPFSQLFSVWTEGRVPSLTENLLILGSRVRRMTNGIETEELQIQIEWEDRAGFELIQRVAQMSEEDPLGIVDQASIQQILGGSDPALIEVKDREGRKVKSTSDGAQWSLEWVGFLPRNTSGLNELLREIGAFSLTEQRASREAARKHREHNAGAFFPYCLYPVTDSIEQWKIGKTEEQLKNYERHYDEDSYYYHLTEKDMASPWKEWYCKWISLCWKQLVSFGVPGVRELMVEQSLRYGYKFEGFDANDFVRGEWFSWFNDCLCREPEGTREEGFSIPQLEVGKRWMPTPHCAIAALEENVENQATEAAKNALKEVIRKLLTNDCFVRKERVSFSTLSKMLKHWPYVIETRRWYQDREKPKWVVDKLPKKNWKENAKDPNCIHIKIGLWANDHYFYWKDDINSDFRVDLWPIEVKNALTVFTSSGKKFIPSLSSGGIMQKLIAGGFLRPLTGLYELYAGIRETEEKDSQKQMMEEFDKLTKQAKHITRRYCLVDTEARLTYKLGTNKVDRRRLFAGDTEAFIDPISGQHDTSMLIIKGIFHNQIEQKTYSWDLKKGNEVVHIGMLEFMKKYMKFVASEIINARPDYAKKPNTRAERKWDNLESIFKKKQELTIWDIKKALDIARIEERDTIINKIKVPIIYFHNLGYDIQPFLCSFAPSKKAITIKKGAVWYKTTFKCKYGEFELRNSLTLITTALRNFPKMFLPKDEQKKMVKEVYAYNAINQAMVEEKLPGKGFKISLEKFKEYIELFEELNDPEKQQKLYEDVIATASKPEVDCVHGEIFDVGKYAEYYCERDVDLLTLGLRCWAAIGEQDASKNTFKGLPPFKKFDVFNFLSAPAIAQAVTEAEVRKGVPILKATVDEESPEGQKYTYKYGGLLRQFMLHAATGGRCTLANERRICEDVLAKNPRVKEIYEKVVSRGEKPTEGEIKEMFRWTIQDFDARSLYPTAMSRSFIPLGTPVVVDWRKAPKTHENIIAEAIDKTAPTDAMYLITKIRYREPLAMPSNCWKQEKPEPRCRWTNKVPENVIQLRKLTDLYTMIETQKATFEVLGGLEWRHGKTEAIQEFMKKTYEFRRLNHSNGFDHPIQEAAKLIMNSFYGKNVTKIREYQEVFFPKVLWKHDEKTDNFYQVNGADNLMDYLKHNWRDIKQVISSGGSYVVKIRAEEDEEAGYDVNFGCEVLAGARALICRVSAAIERITKQPPLYTDTDSLHVYGWQIEEIADWFEKKFRIPMIGGDLGQFHPDFEPQGFKPGEKFMGSVFFCGVGKKMYIDEIVGDQGSTYFHKRAKGINAEWLSKEEYLDLFRGKIIEKDCAKLGGVNIRARDGHNFTVRLIKRVKATAEDEVGIEDEFRTVSNEKLKEIDAGIVDLDRTATEPIEDDDMAQQSIYAKDDSNISAEKRPRDDDDEDDASSGDTVIWEDDNSEILDESTQPEKIIRIQ